MKIKLVKPHDEKQRIFTGQHVKLFHNDGTPYPMDDVARVEIDIRADCVVEARVTLLVSELGTIADGK